MRLELRNQLQRTQVFDGIKQPRDFVFLDLKLPDVSGDEVYSQLKAIHPDLPIVVITGFGTGRPSYAAFAVVLPIACANVLWALFDRDRQFLHDRLTGTRLVRL